MSTQDIAVLAGLQLAILVAAGLAIHTAYAHGYHRGWEDRQELDPWHRMKRAAMRMGEQLQHAARRVTEQLRANPPQLHVHNDVAPLQRELATYRMQEHARTQVDATHAYLTRLPTITGS